MKVSRLIFPLLPVCRKILVNQWFLPWLGSLQRDGEVGQRKRGWWASQVWLELIVCLCGTCSTRWVNYCFFIVMGISGLFDMREKNTSAHNLAVGKSHLNAWFISHQKKKMVARYFKSQISLMSLTGLVKAALVSVFHSNNHQVCLISWLTDRKEPKLGEAYVNGGEDDSSHDDPMLFREIR